MSPRGRGRPPTFLQPDRDRYLTAVSAGLPLADAAALAGITPQWANRIAAADPAFHSARQLAKKEGKQARIDTVPHGEYRYNHHGCRCSICRTKATAARGGRRHTTDEPASDAEPQPPSQVIDMRPSGINRGPTGHPPLLARAS